MVFYETALVIVFLSAYIGLRVLFGFRIYYNDQKDGYFTVREVMFPLVVILFESESWIIYGYSLTPWLMVISAVIGFLLLYRKRELRHFYPKRFIHQYLSIVFLLFEVGTLVIQVGRVI